MIIIDDKLISADVVEKQFICNLEACKGACCWVGDYGAPLNEEERETLKEIYPVIAPFLTEEGRKVIEEKGTEEFFKEPKEWGTRLLENGACAFMTKDENGYAKCGIEQAHQEGHTDFKKPISCHLYPIRIEKNTQYDAVNYDKWEICSAACSLGEKHQMPVYKFVKEALVRKYGQDFYDQLDAAAEQYQHWSVKD